MTASLHRRHHRKRRFHVRREALGHGFEAYSVPAAAEPTPPAPVEAPAAGEEETLSGREKARRLAGKATIISLAIVFLTGVYWLTDWFWCMVAALYLVWFRAVYECCGSD